MLIMKSGPKVFKENSHFYSDVTKNRFVRTVAFFLFNSNSLKRL